MRTAKRPRRPTVKRTIELAIQQMRAQIKESLVAMPGMNYGDDTQSVAIELRRAATEAERFAEHARTVAHELHPSSDDDDAD